MGALNALGVNADGTQAAAVMSKYSSGGVLTREQFRQLVIELRSFQQARSPARQPAAADDIDTTFNRFDADGSGDIDVSELTNALNALGVNADGTQAAAVMSKYSSGGVL